LIDHGGASILILHLGLGLQSRNSKEQENMMKVLKATTPLAAALVAAISFGAMIATDASAAEFCRTDVSGHMTSCGFTSMAQCQASSAGIGGDCFRDPWLNDTKNAYASSRQKAPRSKGGAARAATSPTQ
jgi:hypothetical protein